MGERPNQPLWLELVKQLERAIGAPIESAVRSDEYFDAVTRLKRATARMTKLAEELTESWLHAFNLPAATDVRRLRVQLSRVERQLNEVAKAIADAEEAGEEPRRRLQRVEQQLNEIAGELAASGDGTPRRDPE
jgi:chromosome segregation ATPase